MVYIFFFYGKQALKLQYGAGCEHVTFLGLCNAASDQLELLIIFEGKNV